MTDAIAYLIAHRKSRQDRLPIRAGEEAALSLDLSFVGEPWWPLVVPDTKPKGEPTHISRRWFELCAITEVMRELKVRRPLHPRQRPLQRFQRAVRERRGVPSEPGIVWGALRRAH